MFPFWLKSPLREAAGGGGDGGGGGAPALTLEAIKGVVQETVNNAINGYDKRQTKVITALQDQLKTLVPTKTDDGGDGGGDGKPADGGDKGGKPDPAISRLNKTVEELTKKLQGEADARKAAEAKAADERRASIIRNELAKHQYAKENGIDAAFRLLSDEIKYGEGGELETPDGSPIGEFIGTKLNKEYDYLLAPKQSGGSGAQPGSRGGKAPINLEDIKPGMSNEQRAAALAQIAEAVKG